MTIEEEISHTDQAIIVINGRYEVQNPILIEIFVGNIVRRPDVDALVNSVNATFALDQVTLAPSTQPLRRI